MKKRQTLVDMTWRLNGFTFPLPGSCDPDQKLEVDLRFDKKRAPKKALSITWLGDRMALSVHLDRLKLDQVIKKREQEAQEKKAEKTKNKKTKNEKTKNKKTKNEKTKKKKKKKKKKSLSPSILKSQEDLFSDWRERGDRSIWVWIGIRGLEGNKEPIWYKVKVHEVHPLAHFEARDVHADVGEESLFQSYFTTLTQKKVTSASGFKVLTPLYEFAQAWLPMKNANEIFIPISQNRRGYHTGVYLHDHGRWWWVTSRWLKRGLIASSTHLAGFAVLKDETPPEVGQPQWDMTPPLGPRLIIPISDKGSGIGKVKLKIDRVEPVFEVQRAWSRVIYRPLSPLSQGKHIANVLLSDRSGHLTERTLTFSWPPQEGDLIKSSSLLRFEP